VRCPYCLSGHLGSIRLKETGDGWVDRRRKECHECGKRISTYEKITPASAAEVAEEKGIATREEVIPEAFTEVAAPCLPMWPKPRSPGAPLQSLPYRSSIASFDPMRFCGFPDCSNVTAWLVNNGLSRLWEPRCAAHKSAT